MKSVIEYLDSSNWGNWSILGGLGAIFAWTFFNTPYSKQIKSLDRIQIASSVTCMYDDFMENAKKEIEDILEKLSNNQSEFTAYDNEIKKTKDAHEQSHTRSSDINFFQSEVKAVRKMEDSRYEQLFSAFKELIYTYPKADFESWEYKTRVPVSMVQQAYDDCVKHHTKLTEVANELLTESYVNVQRARDLKLRVDETYASLGKRGGK